MKHVNSNRWFFDKTMAALIKHSQHFRQGVQTLQLHSYSVASTCTLPCWLTIIIVSCIYKLCQLSLQHHLLDNQYDCLHHVYQALHFVSSFHLYQIHVVTSCKFHSSAVKKCITDHISQLGVLRSGNSIVTKLVFSVYATICQKIFTVLPYIPTLHSLQVSSLLPVSFGNLKIWNVTFETTLVCPQDLP